MGTVIPPPHDSHTHILPFLDKFTVYHIAIRIQFRKKNKIPFHTVCVTTTYIGKSGTQATRLYTDNSKEYIGKNTFIFLNDHGDKNSTTIPHHPAQNGTADGWNRAII